MLKHICSRLLRLAEKVGERESWVCWVRINAHAPETCLVVTVVSWLAIQCRQLICSCREDCLAESLDITPHSYTHTQYIDQTTTTSRTKPQTKESSTTKLKSRQDKSCNVKRGLHQGRQKVEQTGVMQRMKINNKGNIDWKEEAEAEY